jgi:hypothetical protein
VGRRVRAVLERELRPVGRGLQEWICWTEIAAPERIALRHGESRRDPNAFESVLTFAADGTATRIEMRTVFPTTKLRDEAIQKYHAIKGGQQNLSNLAAHVTEMVGREWTANCRDHLPLRQRRYRERARPGPRGTDAAGDPPDLHSPRAMTVSIVARASATATHYPVGVSAGAVINSLDVTVTVSEELTVAFTVGTLLPPPLSAAKIPPATARTTAAATIQKAAI